MCSRYEMNGTYEDVELRFKVTGSRELFPIAEVRTTNCVPVIAKRNALHFCRWGLENSWDNKPLINARSETLAEKETFAPFLEERCLIPATAYFEWRRDGEAKIKTRIFPVDGGLFSFAGLKNEERFTIITCAPVSSIAHIHNRMPVILDPTAESYWLSTSNSFQDVAELLNPRQDGFLSSEEVKPPPSKQRDLFD